MRKFTYTYDRNTLTTKAWEDAEQGIAKYEIVCPVKELKTLQITIRYSAHPCLGQIRKRAPKSIVKTPFDDGTVAQTSEIQ